MLRVTRYTAPIPTQAPIEDTLLGTLLSPLKWMWGGLQYGANKLVGEQIGRMVMANYHTTESLAGAEGKLRIALETISRIHELSAKQYEIATHDGAVLHTLEICYDSDLALEQQSYVVNFFGAMSLYENNLNDMMDDARAMQSSVVGFNYRGVSQSTGVATSEYDLVVDGIAQVQRLLDAGISPGNIILKGESLGGAIATLVARHFHYLGVDVILFANRTFSRLTNVIVGQIRTAGRQDDRTGYTEPLFNRVLGGVAWPVTYGILKLVGWELNVVSAYRELPNDKKEYIVVKSNKADRSSAPDVRPKDDPLLTDYGALHAALKKERDEQKIFAINPQEIQQKSNARKMVAADPKLDGHLVDFRDLRHRDNRQGSQADAVRFFHQFVHDTRQQQQPITLRNEFKS